jgi:hypothetical protein
LQQLEKFQGDNLTIIPNSSNTPGFAIGGGREEESSKNRYEALEDLEVAIGESQEICIGT